MHSAQLADGRIVSAKSYEESIHGTQLICMDTSCKAPVFHIKGAQGLTPHFKTSGKGKSVHSEVCGFARQLTFQDSVSKVGEYQSSIMENNIRQYVIRLNMNEIDPDYEKKQIERNPREKEKEEKELDDDLVKEPKETPTSIGSLKAVKKIYTTIGPNILAGIIISVKGQKIPISQMIQSQEQAHIGLWSGETEDIPYFIHGTVERVTRREKVWYISLKNINKGFFSLIVFDRHFHHFTYKDSDLLGKDILAYGYLQKNDYHKDKQSTEMIIKSNKYIEFL